MLGELVRCKAAELAGNSGNTHCFGYIRPHSCVWTGSTLLPLCLSSLCICLAVELHLSAKLLNFWPGQDARILHLMKGERGRCRSATRFCGCHYVFCPVTHTQTHRETHTKLSLTVCSHCDVMFLAFFQVFTFPALTKTIKMAGKKGKMLKVAQKFIRII